MKALQTKEKGRPRRPIQNQDIHDGGVAGLLMQIIRNGAKWSEVDVEERLWTIPAHRMKAGKLHRVPLTDFAVDLLKSQPRLAGSEFIFPAPRGGQLSDMALQAVMRRIHQKRDRGGYVDPQYGRPAVLHVLRSTFLDWAAERTEYPSDMVDRSSAYGWLRG